MQSNATNLTKDGGYNPPSLFWIAYYTNGQALPQIDPESCVENRLKDIDQTNLCKFGWYPFSPEFAAKIQRTNGYNVKCRFLPSYEIELGEHQRLIAKQRQSYTYYGANVRKTVYLLGWQTTLKVDGKDKNVKSIMYIKEDGSVTLGEDFSLVFE